MNILLIFRIAQSITRGIVIVFIILMWEGCASLTSVDLSVRNATKPVSMTSDINREYDVLKHFTVRQKVPLLFFFRLHPDGAAVDINELIEPELRMSQADAIVNFKMRGNAAITDVFLPIGIGVIGGVALSPVFFTLLWLPVLEDLKTYEVEGDLVKYTGQPQQKEQTHEPFDPLTGTPAPKNKKILYDAETGLPIKE